MLKSFILLSIISSYVTFTSCVQEVFTEKEVLALKRLRPLVQDVLYADYMKTDSYLINWLRDKNLEVNKAIEKLKKSIQWRIENNIDGILEDESYPDGKAYAPYSFEGYDNFGRPILTIIIKNWNTRKLALSGKRAQFRRQLQAMLEQAARLARGQGRNITQSIFIGDMSNFNFKVHGCLACVPLYTDSIADYDTHFPLSLKEIIIIKAPAAFIATFQILRPFMSPTLQDSFKVFGYDKEEYMQHIFKNISPNQISHEFGGTKNSIL